jgi:hypothetical protein
MSEELSESRKRLLQGAVDAAQSCMANGWIANESVVGEHVAGVLLGVLEPLIRTDERTKLRQRALAVLEPVQKTGDGRFLVERARVVAAIMSIFDEVQS